MYSFLFNHGNVFLNNNLAENLGEGVITLLSHSVRILHLRVNNDILFNLFIGFSYFISL